MIAYGQRKNLVSQKGDSYLLTGPLFEDPFRLPIAFLTGNSPVPLLKDPYRQPYAWHEPEEYCIFKQVLAISEIGDDMPERRPA